MNTFISVAISLLGHHILGVEFFSLLALIQMAVNIYEGWRKHTDDKSALHQSTPEVHHVYFVYMVTDIPKSSNDEYKRAP